MKIKTPEGTEPNFSILLTVHHVMILGK